MIGDRFLSVVSDYRFQDREVVRKKSESFAFPPPYREQNSDRLGENRDMQVREVGAQIQSCSGQKYGTRMQFKTEARVTVLTTINMENSFSKNAKVKTDNENAQNVNVAYA